MSCARVFGCGVALALAGCDGSPSQDGDQAAGTGGSGPTAGSSPVAGTGGTDGASGLGGAGGQGGSAGARAGSGGVGGMAGARAGSGGAGAGGVGGAAGSAGGGSGTGGSGSGGAGAGGSAAASCAGTSYLICEDFESADLGGTPDGWSKHGDASGVADDEAHESSQSLRLDAIPVWERRIYHDASMLGSAHWGRVYFKVKLPVPNAFVHSTMVAFSGDGPMNGRSEYRVVDTVKQAVDTQDVGSRIQFLWNVQPESADEFGDGTSYDREFDDEWHCAEWHVDASDQSYAFFLDGEELIQFAKGPGNFDGSDIPMSFDELKIGWINYQDAPPGFTAWLDDLAVDDDRPGCL